MRVGFKSPCASLRIDRARLYAPRRPASRCAGGRPRRFTKAPDEPNFCSRSIRHPSNYRNGHRQTHRHTHRQRSPMATQRHLNLIFLNLPAAAKSHPQLAHRLLSWGGVTKKMLALTYVHVDLLFIWAKRNFILVDQTGRTSNFVCVFFMHR